MGEMTGNNPETQLSKFNPEKPLINTATSFRSTAENGLSIVIPTYNESETIETVISRLQEALRKSDYEYEIIVVDDDSPDNTWRLVELLFENDPVRVIRRTNERGLGSAIADGIADSQYKYCAIIDADLQHPPEVLPRLALHAGSENDLVIGSRYTDFGRIDGWSLHRRVVSKGAITLAKTLFPEIRSISDPLSGLFIVDKRILEESHVDPIGYKFLLEILIRCKPRTVREVPYVFSKRNGGESKLSGREYISFLRHLYELRTGETR